MLRLVKLAGDEGDGCALQADRLAVGNYFVWPVPRHEFRASNRDRGGDFDRSQQLGERGWFWRVVVGEKPQPLIRGFGSSHDRDGVRDERTKTCARRTRNVLAGVCCREKSFRTIGRAGVNDNNCVGAVGLRRKGGESSAKKGCPIAGNDYRTDSGMHLNNLNGERSPHDSDTHDGDTHVRKSWCGGSGESRGCDVATLSRTKRVCGVAQASLRSLRRSRSESPPQIPKRSSLASA